MSTLLRETLATPLGQLVLVSDADGALLGADFVDTEARLQRSLERRFGRAGWRLERAQRGLDSPRLQALRAYFQGALHALHGLPLQLHGSDLQREVWPALRAVAPGRTESYAELAARIDRAGSARAIGTAVAANPLLLVLPCHRIVGAGGALTGYAAGIERKRWLLEHEGVLPRLPSGASGRALRV
jgi:methylated-DNA-[protein]-cysteine S-methyltransferase